MKDITKKLQIRYNTYNVDWLNFNILDDNDLTFHHIEKSEDGGKYSEENGALLTKRAQSYLHYIEEIDYAAYFFLNAVLEKINIQGYNPTKEQQKLIENIFNIFEDENYKQICGNGKKGKIYSHTKRIKSQNK